MLVKILGGKNCLITMCCFLLAFLAFPNLSAVTYSNNPGLMGKSSSQAVLYYHPNCSHCKKVEAYLAKINRTITMKNVSNPAYQRELQALGQRGVPVLVVGNEVIVGSTPIISYLSSHQELLR